LGEKERMMELKRLFDQEEIKNKEHGKQYENFGKKAKD